MDIMTEPECPKEHWLLKMVVEEVAGEQEEVLARSDDLSKDF